MAAIPRAPHVGHQKRARASAAWASASRDRLESAAPVRGVAGRLTKAAIATSDVGVAGSSRRRWIGSTVAVGEHDGDFHRLR
jgi:hypothetical protein